MTMKVQAITNNTKAAVNTMVPIIFLCGVIKADSLKKQLSWKAKDQSSDVQTFSFLIFDMSCCTEY